MGKNEEDSPISLLRTYAATTNTDGSTGKRKSEEPGFITMEPTEIHMQALHRFAWTSRYCIESFRRIATSCNNDIALNIDGTFTLVRNGWVPIILGPTVVYYHRKELHSNYIRSNKNGEPAFVMAMNSLKYCATNYLGIDNIRLINCFFHVKQAIRRQLKGKFNHPNSVLNFTDYLPALL